MHGPPVSAFWPQATATLGCVLFCCIFLKTGPRVWVILAQWSYSKPVNPAAVCCDQFWSYNFKPVRRIFLYQARETLFNLSKNILPLSVVVEKIDGARGESLYVLLDSCQRYYQGIRGMLCLVESAYKAIGFLKEKATHEFFLRVLLANSCFTGLILLFLRSITSIHVNFDLIYLFFLSPNKARQHSASGCQKSPRQMSFCLFLKTGRDSALCVIFP